jgi:IclR family transcriptional regulator, acetate operon repressor
MNEIRTESRSASAPLGRSFYLLELIVNSDGPVGIADLAERAAIPGPSVHRLVSHLTSERMVRVDPATRGLVPGPRLWELFLKAQAGSWSMGPVRSIMETLVGDVRETCNLGVFDRNAVLYIERVECDWPIRVQLAAGSRVPLHASAIGKLLMAHLPAPARRKLVEGLDKPALTANTLTADDVLQDAFGEIRKSGYALNNSENVDGLIGLAVPVRAQNGRVIAGLSVHAPETRLKLSRTVDLLPRFQRAANEIGEHLNEGAGK